MLLWPFVTESMMELEKTATEPGIRAREGNYVPMPAEFTIMVMAVYIALDANANIALGELHRAVTSQQIFHSDAVHIWAENFIQGHYKFQKATVPALHSAVPDTSHNHLPKNTTIRIINHHYQFHPSFNFSPLTASGLHTNIAVPPERNVFITFRVFSASSWELTCCLGRISVNSMHWVRRQGPDGSSKTHRM